jgi:hypothetical protein
MILLADAQPAAQREGNPELPLVAPSAFLRVLGGPIDGLLPKTRLASA